jgi:hypothetical protein
MGKSSAPPSPDYVGAANAQGAANRDAALQSGMLSNPAFSNPFGSRDVNYYDQGGGFMKPMVVDKLSPLGQSRFDQEQRIVGSVGNIAEGGLGRVDQAYSRPFGIQNVNDLQNKAESLMSARIEPQLARNREATQTQLITRGHNPQNESYKAQMDQLGQQENDARRQGILSAMQMRPQTLQEELSLRNQPLNELNALRTGSQVSLPQFQQFQGANVAGAPVFNAAQAQGQYDINRYGIQQGGQNNMMGGLFGLGGAAINAWG